MNNYIYSDLACELSENYDSYTSVGSKSSYESSVICSQDDYKSIHVSRINVKDEQGQNETNLSIGSYVTISFDDSTKMTQTQENELSAIISDEIIKLMPDNSKKILICGLGNKNMTTDSVGPKTVEKTTITRHIKENFENVYTETKYISALSPGVLAQTGIESADIISAISEKIHPDVIITIDSICTKSQNRLCKTLQITDTGVSPGSGVENKRPTINSALTKSSVISIGFPTVINSATLIYEMMNEIQHNTNDSLEEKLKNNVSYYVTINEIDEITEIASRIIANAIDIISGVI